MAAISWTRAFRSARQVHNLLKMCGYGQNEREKRLCAAFAAAMAGRGGASAVARITGLARSTIHRGILELERPTKMAPGKQRRPGGGRKPSAAVVSGQKQV